MRKILFAALITTAGIWLVIGGCRCNPKEPDDKFTNWSHFILKDSAQILIDRLTAAMGRNKGIDSIGHSKAIDYGLIKSRFPQSYLYIKAKSMMRNMMLRDSCSGMRVYYGLTLKNEIVPIICGVTSRGDDIYWRRPKDKEGTLMQGIEYEEGLCDMSRPEPPPPSATTRYLIDQ